MPNEIDAVPACDSAIHNWAIVLAGGEGSRLQKLTTTSSGVCVPKQFCSFNQGPSLLHAALERAMGATASERTSVVLAQHHRRWWEHLQLGLPEDNVIAQPFSRGTAHGILLPLLQILHRDPDACVLVLPSDHYVRAEPVLAASLKQAMARTRDHDEIILLGMEPEEADPELGYIVTDGKPDRDVRTVTQFVEKPTASHARALIERGGLWNSFIFAANSASLLKAFEARCPEAVTELRSIIEQSPDRQVRDRRIAGVYETLPPLDFSRDILQRDSSRLGVIAVRCGWSDLGTPRRVADVLDRKELRSAARRAVAPHARGFLDLAARHAQLQVAR
jgi:mannose-1-phosphate guanylyltransferase